MSNDELPPGWDTVPSSGSTRVAFHERDAVYYKEFFTQSPLELARAQLFGSRATLSRRNNEQLILAGFDAPTTTAWGKLPGGAEYLIAEAVPGRSITQWLREELTDKDAQTLALRKQLLSELGVFVGRVHATGIAHGELLPHNVLADLRSTGFRFALLDNERNTWGKPTPGTLLLKNLAQLNMLTARDLSRSERIRFFIAWHSQMRELSALEGRLLAREAFLRAQRLMSERGQQS